MSEKFEKLCTLLKRQPSPALAFSGGADSSFLLFLIKKMEVQQFTAFTVSSQFVPEQEVLSAQKTALKYGVPHIILETDVFEHQNIIKNSDRRCYYCKQEMFSLIRRAAGETGCLSFICGDNLDDLDDDRPGRKAAQELGFVSPLAETGITKQEVRTFSRKEGLETWNKPSQSCYAARIAVDEKISLVKLKRIEQAESLLKESGFDQIRVRCEKDNARIEVDPEQVGRLVENRLRLKLLKKFRGIGFDRISIDMEGYRG